MAWMEVLAPAKINLFLELIERRSDGFHELETIMTSVNLFDRILLRRRPDDQINLTQLPKGPGFDRAIFSMPVDQSNLVWQAIELLRQRSGTEFGVDVAVQKNIPGQAGLGGGSSDAAASLMGVNLMFGLGQTNEQLHEIGHKLGSDVAFFLDGSLARCTGRGEKIESIRDTQVFPVVLAMPPVGLSTADVYRQSVVSGQPEKSGSLISGLRNGDVRQVGQALWNRLQVASERLCPWILRLQQAFSGVGSFGHQMTGSGSGYFGIFANRRSAVLAKNKLASRLPDCTFFCVNTGGFKTGLIRYRVE